MSYKSNFASAALAGVMAVTGAASTGFAAPIAPRAPAVADGVAVDQVWHRGMRHRRTVVRTPDGARFVYREGRHGPRYRYKRAGYGYYRDGYYYQRPFWLGAAAVGIVGGVIAGAVARDRAGDAWENHVAWCEARFRSYDARSDTYIARAGYPPVRCNSPYL